MIAIGLTQTLLTGIITESGTATTTVIGTIVSDMVRIIGTAANL